MSGTPQQTARVTIGVKPSQPDLCKTQGRVRGEALQHFMVQQCHFGNTSQRRKKKNEKRGYFLWSYQTLSSPHLHSLSFPTFPPGCSPHVTSLFIPLAPFSDLHPPVLYHDSSMCILYFHPQIRYQRQHVRTYLLTVAYNKINLHKNTASAFKSSVL